MTSIEAIINRQLKRWELEQRAGEHETPAPPRPAPIVTVSRETGSRGSYFGSRLAQRLGYQRLHREVIDAICESSGYRKRIVEALDEKVRTEMEAVVESLFTGQMIDHSDYIRHLARVLLSMAELGGVVVMGRGANFILGPRRGFHIRVVCPREKRIENLIKYKEYSREDAERVITHSDRQRREYVRKLFSADINDPLHYDLVLNSALIDVEEMVATAVTAIDGKMNKLRYLHHDSM